MSVKIERKQLVDIAQGVYSGNEEIEAHLKKSLKKKPVAAIFKKIEERVWRMIAQDHPLKDFTGQQESLTRRNILKRICTVLKSKFFSYFMYKDTSMWLR